MEVVRKGLTRKDLSQLVGLEVESQLEISGVEDHLHLEIDADCGSCHHPADALAKRGFPEEE